jgi:Tol biopolymer transport system component
MKTTALVIAAQCAAFSGFVTLAHAQDLQLTWVDRSGTVIGTVGPPGPYRGPAVAPDGRRFAVHSHVDSKDPSKPGAGDIYVFQSGPGPGKRVTGDGSNTIETTMPIWSPDGMRIAYGSIRRRKGGLYVKRADGAGREELLFESESGKVPVSWSPDGKFIVYWEAGDVQWVLPLTGARKPFQLSRGSTSHAQISPDGKWVAYNNTVAGSQIYVKPFPTGDHEVRVSKEGGVFARWRGDGKELYFLSTGRNSQMMAADITTEGGTIKAGTPHALFESRYINFGHNGGGNYHVFDVTHDGQRFLIPRVAALAPDDPNARTLTLFDREGKSVGTFGERGPYNVLSMSPDGTRVSVLKNDLATNIADFWVIDIGTGRETRITSNTRDETTNGFAAWSPDGKELAYAVQRAGTQSIYRRRSDGQGAAELVFTLPGFSAAIQEWTADGKYLTYYAQQLGGNIVFALPMSGEKKPIEVARSEFPLIAARLSPDNRFLAFRSKQGDKDQIWVRRFDPAHPSTEQWQISKDGGTGPVYWRADGREIIYLSLDRRMMSVSVHMEPTLSFDAPRQLFTIPESFALGAGIGGVATMRRDGERFLIAVPPAPRPPAPQPQVALLDRRGQVVKKVTGQERYTNPLVSPDGTHVLVFKNPEGAGDPELLCVDVATGKDVRIAKGNVFSALWSRDARQVFYVLNRNGLNIIMRKAADGSGADEEIYRHIPGSPVDLDDVSPDGRWLAFDSGPVILMLPLSGANSGDRHPVEFSREEYFVFSARFSRDGRSVAYIATETERSELYVRRFNPATGEPADTEKSQLTTDGISSLLSWKDDGREVYYQEADVDGALTMAVEVSVGDTVRAGTPKFLFRSRKSNGPTRDGQRFAALTRP